MKKNTSEVIVTEEVLDKAMTTTLHIDTDTIPDYIISNLAATTLKSVKAFLNQKKAVNHERM